jgi:hypothetical protein
MTIAPAQPATIATQGVDPDSVTTTGVVSDVGAAPCILYVARAEPSLPVSVRCISQSRGYGLGRS